MPTEKLRSFGRIWPPFLLRFVLLVVLQSWLFSQPRVILISPETQYQRMEGFGITVGNGAAREINALPAAERERILELLFGSGGARFNIVRNEIW